MVQLMFSALGTNRWRLLPGVLVPLLLLGTPIQAQQFIDGFSSVILSGMVRNL